MKTRNEDSAGDPGAWIPWRIAQYVCSQKLRPASRWNVFLAILYSWCRYGRKEAWLTARQIAEETQLSERTVKAALKDLIVQGLVSRIGRSGKLRINLRLRTEEKPAGEILLDGEDKIAPAKGTEGCPSSNCSSSLSLTKRLGVTKKQHAAIRKALAEATDLLGSDAGGLTLPEEDSQRLEVASGITFREAIELLEHTCDFRTAHRLTAVVLKLQVDERVQGRELDLQSNKRTVG